MTATPTASAVPQTLVLDEHANGTTVRVAVGSTVRIELHSTYWPQASSSATNVVQPTGSSVTGTPGCVPGGGCGVVTSTFVARSTGSARLTAERPVCGEAMPCPPEWQKFTVTVEVIG
jgi:hypothetical protein